MQLFFNYYFPSLTFLWPCLLCCRPSLFMISRVLRDKFPLYSPELGTRLNEVVAIPLEHKAADVFLITNQQPPPLNMDKKHISSSENSTFLSVAPQSSGRPDLAWPQNMRPQLRPPPPPGNKEAHNKSLKGRVTRGGPALGANDLMSAAKRGRTKTGQKRERHGSGPGACSHWPRSELEPVFVLTSYFNVVLQSFDKNVL